MENIKHIKALKRRLSARKKWWRDKVAVLSEKITWAKQDKNELTGSRRAGCGFDFPRERFCQLSDSLNVVIWCMDVESRFTYVSEAARSLLGFEPEALIGKTIDAVLTQAAAAEARALIDARNHSIPEPLSARLELVHRRIDGTEFWGEILTHPILDDQGRVVEIQGTMRDISQRKRAEAAAQESDRMLRGILRAVPFGIGVTRDRTMIWSNDQMVRLIGHSEVKFRGLSARILFENDQEFRRVGEALEKGMTETGTGRIETRLVRKDGSHFEALVLGVHVNPSDLSSDVITTVADISDRKQMEDALRKSEKKYRELVENANSIILRMDVNGRVTFFNEFAQRFFGYAEDEILGRNVVGTIVSETECADRGLRAIIQDIGRNPGKYLNNENENVCRDGARVWIAWTNKPIFDAEGRCTEILCIGNDISERKRAEMALVESERLSRTIVNGSPIPAFIIGEDHSVMHWNKALEELSGIQAEEIVGTRQHWKAFYRHERPCLADLVLSGDTHGISDWYAGKCNKFALIEGAYEGTDFFPDLGDSGKWLRSIAAVIRDSHGQVVGAMETLEDITLRKRAEEEREKLETQLRHAQKMEAVGQLAGGVAHDFNNLLQVILGYTDDLQADPSEDAVHAEALEAVRQAAERAADLTRQLLVFSRRQVLQPVNLNLNDLVDGVLKIVRRVIGEHIDLRFKPGERLGTVHVDKGQMEQILMNLCVNARDAMPDGGTLAIETENVVIGDEYRHDHPWGPVGPYVLFRVSDTGHGMDETTRARIFEPFFTTKHVGQGTGLGLATVYGIVKQHNGFIHVYSEPDKGSVFNVYIPSVQRAAESVETKLEVAAVGGTETILVAEDEELVRRLASSVLQSAGYSVLTACDGEDALRIFEGHADAIDLVILDVMMPKLNGRAVMDHIHASCPRIRFLFTSGYSANAIHTNFVIKAGLRLITKPYSRVELLRAVRERLDVPNPRREG